MGAFTVGKVWRVQMATVAKKGFSLVKSQYKKLIDELYYVMRGGNTVITNKVVLGLRVIRVRLIRLNLVERYVVESVFVTVWNDQEIAVGTNEGMAEKCAEKRYDKQDDGIRTRNVVN